MPSKKEKQTEWNLTRERFHIPDRFPPKPSRKERGIKDIISDVLNETPESELPAELISHWELIVGPQISKHTHPANLRQGTLHIFANHPGWLTEIRRLPKNNILKKISSIPKMPEIHDIRFHLDPSIRTWRNRD